MSSKGSSDDPALEICSRNFREHEVPDAKASALDSPDAQTKAMKAEEYLDKASNKRRAFQDAATDKDGNIDHKLQGRFCRAADYADN